MKFEMNTMSLDFLFKFLFSKKAGALIKIISWLSVCGLGIGVASLVIVLSVMNGFNRSIRERKFSVEPHLVVYFAKATPAEIRSHPGVAWLKTQPQLKNNLSESQDVILRTSDGFVQGAVAQGLSSDVILQMIRLNRQRHRLPDLTEAALAPGEILVGGGLGDTMGLFENDQLVVISPESLLTAQDGMKQVEMVKVKNFIRTEIDEIDSQKIYYVLDESLSRLRNTASLERTLEIRIPDPENYEAIKAKLESLGLRVDSWKDRNSNLFYSLRLEKFVVGLLLGLSTLIASFSLITVMVLLMTQKRKDIGLMLALGFKPLLLRNVFAQIGVYLAVLGIFAGLFGGVLLSYLIGKYSHGLLPSIYEETNVPTEIHSSQIVLVLVVALLFSFVTTWLSVRKLSDLQPIDALKGVGA